MSVFSYIAKKLKFWNSGGFEQRQKRGDDEEQPNGTGYDDGPSGKLPENATLDKSLEKNVQIFKQIFGESGDFVIRDFRFGPSDTGKGAILYIDGLVNAMLITESILKPVLTFASYQKRYSGNMIDEIKESVITTSQVEDNPYFSELAKGCADGDTVFLFDGYDRGLIINSKGWEQRSVDEPQSEHVVRGPREGFTENLRTNTALLRRRIKTPLFRMEQMVIGRQTKTGISIAYIEGIAKPDVVKKVKYRLSKIDVDSIVDSGYIEQYIEDHPFSIFPTIGYSEKPDVVAAKILEGRVAIVVDGSPFVLTVPLLFYENFQASEDYYIRTLYASTSRILRYLAFAITVLGPGVFIALTTYHQELIPTTLLFTVAAAREGTPFPAFLEAIIMVMAFQIIREGGIRLPRHVGQAISIVGALVMGQAAVSAGIVGAPMVIIIAITAVAEFVVPNLNECIAVLRLFFLICATALGGYGLTMGMIALFINIGALESFGVEFFSGSKSLQEYQDSYIRMPLWFMENRPADIASGNMKRRSFFKPPARPNKQK